MQTTLAITLLAAALTFLAPSAQAASASENLNVVATSAGDYVIDPASGVMCLDAFQKLNVQIDQDSQTIRLTFVGNGTMNDQPTAGEVDYPISLSKEVELLRMPGRAFMRTVLEGNAVVNQTREIDPFAGQFGLTYNDSDPLMTFVSTNRLVLSPGPYVCAFIR